MSPETFQTIAALFMSALALYLSVRKQPAEIGALKSGSMKNIQDVNMSLSKQVLELRERIEMLEQSTVGPFRLLVEFSTGEHPTVHKAELVLIQPEAGDA